MDDALTARLDRVPALSSRARTRMALMRSPLTVAGFILIFIFAVSALLAPLIAPYGPIEQILSERLQPPSLTHLLGTDQLGRDLFSRLLFGARISLTVGVVVVASAGAFGTSIGLIAGYAGGIVDEVLMRVTDIFFAFPPLILAMAIAGALGPNLNNAMIAIAVVLWPVYARLVRGQVLSLREREFIQAARCVGASTPRILWRHLLPNTLAPLLVQASFDLGGAILSIAGLSFIGFGAQPPTPEWGVMISEGRKFISTQPWLSLFPGLAILFSVAAFNLIGDGLRDALDPRLRGILSQ
jgi:peptide/nickel transport system permease protein